MTLYKNREQKIKQMDDFLRDALRNLMDRLKRHEKIDESDTTSARFIDAGWEQKIVLKTLDELLTVDEPQLVILGSSHTPENKAGSLYTFTGMKGDGEQWWDHDNQYVVGADDIMLPATVVFVPKERQEAWS